MIKKYYKYPKQKTKLNKFNFITIIVIFIVSFIGYIVFLKYYNYVSSSIQHSLNVFSIFSGISFLYETLFKNLFLREPNKKEVYKNISEHIKKFNENERINDEIERNSKF